MSGLRNSLVIVLNGGKGSGWFNPDHAAAVASENVHLVREIWQGEGKELIYGIVNNYAVLESLKQVDNAWTYDYTEDPTDIYKTIENEGKKQKGIRCLLKRKVGKEFKDVTDYNAADQKATTLIYQVASIHKEIANELSKVAKVERAESYTGDSKIKARKWLDMTRKYVKQSEYYSIGLLDDKNKYSPISQVLKNTQSSLDAYLNSLIDIRG